ncbi:hypothetical protein PHMEG_00019155 [Phytophthora megakarya]|uniref:Uncharacterized protein n=1 Tax=Phytophthora megakarya TaxID=4795 RepID=A0A225VSK7_9STRA|nr:hypothetical protein PHMEG_00019155 [Phytophthora megakarya]
MTFSPSTAATLVFETTGEARLLGIPATREHLRSDTFVQDGHGGLEVLIQMGSLGLRELASLADYVAEGEDIYDYILTPRETPLLDGELDEVVKSVEFQREIASVLTEFTPDQFSQRVFGTVFILRKVTAERIMLSRQLAVADQTTHYVAKGLVEIGRLNKELTFVRAGYEQRIQKIDEDHEFHAGKHRADLQKYLAEDRANLHGLQAQVCSLQDQLRAVPARNDMSQRPRMDVDDIMNFLTDDPSVPTTAYVLVSRPDRDGDEERKDGDRFQDPPRGSFLDLTRDSESDSTKSSGKRKRSSRSPRKTNLTCPWRSQRRGGGDNDDEDDDPLDGSPSESTRAKTKRRRIAPAEMKNPAKRQQQRKTCTMLALKEHLTADEMMIIEVPRNDKVRSWVHFGVRMRWCDKSLNSPFGQMPGFPSYTPNRHDLDILQRRFADYFHKYREIFREAPWQDMWRNRPKLLYLHKRSAMTPTAQGALDAWVEYMCESMRHQWEMLHWVIFLLELLPESAVLAESRRGKRHESLVKKGKSLKKRCIQKGVPATVFEWEVSVWDIPHRVCHWIIMDKSQIDPVIQSPSPLREQLQRLDKAEPTRLQWTNCDSVEEQIAHLPEAVRKKILPKAEWGSISEDI